MRVEHPSVHLQGEIHGIELSCTVAVEAEMMISGGCLLQHPGKLLYARCTAGGNKHGIAQVGVCHGFFLLHLVECHRIEGTLKPIHILGFWQRGGKAHIAAVTVQPAYPHAFRGIAPRRHALVGGLALGIGTAAFLQTDNLFAWPCRKRQGKSEISKYLAVLPVLGGKEEMAAKGALGVKVYAPVLEIGIELLLALPIIHTEALQVIFVNVK